MTDLREEWQIRQGRLCGCGGQDDMCACQNMNPWPQPPLIDRLIQAVRECPSLDTNGYITEKSEVIKAIKKVMNG